MKHRPVFKRIISSVLLVSFLLTYLLLPVSCFGLVAEIAAGLGVAEGLGLMDSIVGTYLSGAGVDVDSDPSLIADFYNYATYDGYRYSSEVYAELARQRDALAQEYEEAIDDAIAGGVATGQSEIPDGGTDPVLLANGSVVTSPFVFGIGVSAVMVQAITDWINEKAIKVFDTVENVVKFYMDPTYEVPIIPDVSYTVPIGDTIAHSLTISGDTFNRVFFDASFNPIASRMVRSSGIPIYPGADLYFGVCFELSGQYNLAPFGCICNSSGQFVAYCGEHTANSNLEYCSHSTGVGGLTPNFGNCTVTFGFATTMETLDFGFYDAFVSGLPFTVSFAKNQGSDIHSDLIGILPVYSTGEGDGEAVLGNRNGTRYYGFNAGTAALGNGNQPPVPVTVPPIDLGLAPAGLLYQGNTLAHGDDSLADLTILTVPTTGIRLEGQDVYGSGLLGSGILVGGADLYTGKHTGTLTGPDVYIGSSKTGTKDLWNDLSGSLTPGGVRNGGGAGTTPGEGEGTVVPPITWRVPQNPAIPANPVITVPREGTGDYVGGVDIDGEPLPDAAVLPWVFRIPILGPILQWLINIYETLKNFLGTFKDFVSHTFNNFKDWLKSIWDVLVNIFNRLGEILNALLRLLGDLPATLLTIFEIVTGYTLFQELLDGFLPEVVVSVLWVFWMAAIAIWLVRWLADR